MSYEQSRQWDDGSGAGDQSNFEKPEQPPRVSQRQPLSPHWQDQSVIDDEQPIPNRWLPGATSPRYPRASFDNYNPAPQPFQSRSPWADPFAGRRSQVSSPPGLMHDNSSFSSTASILSVPTPPAGFHQRNRSFQSSWDSQHRNYKSFSSDSNPVSAPLQSPYSSLSSPSIHSPCSQPISPPTQPSYDPFAPPQARTFAEQPTFAQRQTRHRLSHDDLPEPDRRMLTDPPARKRSDPQVKFVSLNQDVRNQPSGLSQFDIHLQSELNRRNIANKTINTIRSTQAKALAQAKEDARRAEWTKNAYIKFPVETASSDSPLLSGRDEPHRPTFNQGDAREFRPAY